MFDSLSVSASGLVAQRERLNVIAENMANVNTTRDASGRPNPYRRQVAVLQAAAADAPGVAGVRTAGVELDASPFRRVFDPTHPDADREGYVNFPNVDILTETVDALTATRAYEANIAAIEATKGMATAALRIIA